MGILSVHIPHVNVLNYEGLPPFAFYAAALDRWPGAYRDYAAFNILAMDGMPVVEANRFLHDLTMGIQWLELNRQSQTMRELFDTYAHGAANEYWKMERFPYELKDMLKPYLLRQYKTRLSVEWEEGRC